ncbi:cytochrome b/b6 domain-containing protein [Enterovibrio norvegicus]|uniref:cytochrome b/b6 domain-containing protein n=1 Tax=Enterovibrio norvegicus TaxID=188144 RepID=UPI003D10D0BB
MKIWDLPTRLYHWLQALLFTLLAITGFNATGPHELLGIALSGLLVWRILWGMFGSETSRFRQFLRSPNTVYRYMKGQHPHHGAGHNPAGGWMVIAMLSLLLTQCFVGMSMAGFFDAFLSDDSLLYDTDLLVMMHLYGAYLLVATVALHISAIIFYKRKGTPLVKAMITGTQKHLPRPISVFFRSNIRAGIMLISVGGMFGMLLS